MFDIQRKVGLISGGAGGIGSAIVQKLFEKGLRAALIIDTNESAGQELCTNIEKKYGPNKIFYMNVDVTISREVDDAFQTVINKFQNIDIVINAAGISDEKDWEKTIDINLMAVMRITYLAKDKYIPKYKTDKEGIVLNISSVLGLCNVTSIPAYCVSKIAVIKLGACLGGAYNYEATKTKVITVCPGPVQTNILKDLDKKLIYPTEMIGETACFMKNGFLLAEDVATGIVYTIENGNSGSIWTLTEKDKAVEHDLSDFRNFFMNN